MRIKQIMAVLVALALALAFGNPAMAQVTGTNAVTALESNVDNAINTAWPWALGMMGISIAVGAFFWLYAKGKKRG